MSLTEYARTAIELRSLRKNIIGQLRAHKLSYGEFEVLNMLKNEQITQPNHIANKLAYDISAVSRILGKLHLGDYISYVNAEDDRRCVFVRITDYGKKLIDSLLKTYSNE